MQVNYSIIKTDKLTLDEKCEILTLWNEEYPSQLGHKNIESLEAYLEGCAKKLHWFAQSEDGSTCGWLMCFERDDERWFAMIVSRAHQGKGLGKALLTEAKKVESILNGWAVDKTGYYKRDDSPYGAPLEFYLKNGFEVKPEVRFETEILSSVKIVWASKTR